MGVGKRSVDGIRVVRRVDDVRCIFFMASGRQAPFFFLKKKKPPPTTPVLNSRMHRLPRRPLCLEKHWFGRRFSWNRDKYDPVGQSRRNPPSLRLRCSHEAQRCGAVRVQSACSCMVWQPSCVGENFPFKAAAKNPPRRRADYGYSSKRTACPG